MTNIAKIYIVVLNHKTVLITGGTGSFGKKFVEMILKKYPDVQKVIVYSRDELKQFEMAQVFSEKKYPCMRYFIGDVRDKDRLMTALKGVDVVIHAAAIKQVPTAEYNPFECIKTNVLGAQNVIEAAIERGVHRVVALSTDKAAAPINLYGASKLCSDKLFVAANYMKGKANITFSVVRYGNVMGSRGSVIPFFLQRQHDGVLPITHADMTRFNITLEQGVEMVFFALENSIGGEVFVPKIPSYRILDLAQAIAPKSEHKLVGIRPGEKIHEEMITSTDSLNTLELDKYFVIVPYDPFAEHEDTIKKYSKKHQGKLVPEGFAYSSGANSEWLSVEQLRKLIVDYVDPNFTV